MAPLSKALNECEAALKRCGDQMENASSRIV